MIRSLQSYAGCLLVWAAACAPAGSRSPGDSDEGAARPDSAAVDVTSAAVAASAAVDVASAAPLASASSSAALPASAPLSAFAAKPAPAPDCLAICAQEGKRCDSGAAREKDMKGQLRRCGCAKISCEDSCARGEPPDFSCH